MSVVVAAGIHPTVAIPTGITGVVVAPVAANEEDLFAVMESVSHNMPVHNMPIDVCAVPGTRHGTEASWPDLSGVDASHMAAGKSSVASTEASATMSPSTMAAATSGKDFTWSQDQEGACERNANSTVHGYLHVKGGIFRATGHQRSDGQWGDTLSFVASVHRAGYTGQPPAVAIFSCGAAPVLRRLPVHWAAGSADSRLKPHVLQACALITTETGSTIIFEDPRAVSR